MFKASSCSQILLSFISRRTACYFLWVPFVNLLPSANAVNFPFFRDFELSARASLTVESPLVAVEFGFIELDEELLPLEKGLFEDITLESSEAD